jgi:regulator of protease activity HflC (stomatin/prohibitin superfamily)
MARQAEAEREKRGMVIHAEGELQASQKLAEAASIMAAEPASLQLRYLSTLTQIAEEKTSTIIFPIPIEFVAAFARLFDRAPTQESAE